MAAINPWKLTPVAGKQTEIPSSGIHKAVVIGLFDLGTTKRVYKGNEFLARAMFLVWELVEEKLAGTNRNHTIGREFSLSISSDGELVMGPKSDLRKFLGDWGGNSLVVGKNFDITKTLGQVCWVQISHTTKGEATYAIVSSASKTKPGENWRPTIKPVLWSVTEPGEPPTDAWIPYTFGKSITERAKVCNERQGQQPATDSEVIGDDDPDGSNVPDSAHAEEIPF